MPVMLSCKHWSTKFTCIPNTTALENGTEKQDDAQNGGARWVELGFFSGGGVNFAKF